MNKYCKDCQERQEKLDKIEKVALSCIDYYACNKCQFYNECNMYPDEFVLRIIRGEE